MLNTANEYRAWESFCRLQAAAAASELGRRGLERAAELCSAAADDIETSRRHMTKGGWLNLSTLLMAG